MIHAIITNNFDSIKSMCAIGDGSNAARAIFINSDSDSDDDGPDDSGALPSLGENVRFYRNERPFPGGVTIEEFFTTWSKDYSRLERTHNYVQWVFPCSTASSFNSHAVPLSTEEMAVFKEDTVIRARLVRSFKIILEFLGFELHEGTTIVRGGWSNGLRNVTTNPHNLLRITRILQCLRETGMVEWQRRFMTALLAASAAGNFPTNSVAIWKNQLAVDDVHPDDGAVMRIEARTERCVVLSAGMAYLLHSIALLTSN